MAIEIPGSGGGKVVFMVFTWTENGTPRTTRIALEAHDTSDGFADRSVTVATLLAEKIQSLGGFTLTSAESAQEVRVNLLA